jgi:diguanylate cyclase (GGDEF)-like protein
MNDSTLALLAILITANILLIGLAVGRSVLRRRRERDEAPARPIATARPVSGANGTAASVDRGPTAAAAATADSRGAPPRTDPLTGLLRQAEWDRILIDEAARIERYGRPATVVFIDVEGLERLTSVLGPTAGDRILPALANVLARQARGSDHVARLGPGRFGVLLTETGEVEAVNYVERVRLACELWLESGAIAMRLAIGWAAPPAEGGLADAFALAQDRMFAELRRGERRATDLAPPDRPPSGHDFEGSPSPA